ncbi:hypothetical protein LUZ60_000917 [Juncus effusus]|nr:hypothetical protein LUZ60_000917 [Juncus effusus]
MESTTAGPSLNDCLKLLRGEKDEQKLAGLLLATKFCQGDDNNSILKVYNAVGPRFLRRLLITGMGNTTGSERTGEDKEAYLRLSVTILSSFSRVDEISSSKDIIDMVPLLAEIVSKMPDQSVVEECYEFFLMVCVASQNGVNKFYEPQVIDLLASNISNLPDGCKSLELAIKLLQLLVSKLNLENMSTKNIQGISSMVVCLARLFCELHSAIKFDALHMLASLLSLKEGPLHDALESMPSRVWSTQIRVGITSILQNRIVSSEKLQALLLAECMISILGEDWLLLQENNLTNQKDFMPNDKFVLLLLESARIEIAVLLNEIAYLKYDESAKSSSDSINQKQRSLAIAFSLLEKFIKMISNWSEDQVMNESTIMKAISGLNETISLVLDFLQDSKEHEQRKGDDLLASVRIIGSYLAEAPQACKEKTRNLLEYILSIEGQDESSPFYSVCFMLPFLSQISLELDGCRILASFEGYKIVVDCVVKLIEQDRMINDDNAGTIVLACDAIINFLTNGRNIKVQAEAQYLKLLQIFPLWAGNSTDPAILIVASCVCVLILDLTSEEFLLGNSEFDPKTLEILSHLIIASLNQRISQDDEQLMDQRQTIISGYKRWAGRYPRISSMVQHSISI